MGLKEDFSFKDKGNRINPRCEGTGAFRDLQLVFFSFCNLFCLSAGACEMQPLPDRCVAPQLQPTGLYRQNQFVRVVHATKTFRMSLKM